MRPTVAARSARSRSSRSRTALSSMSPPVRQNWPVLPLDVSKRRSGLHLLDVREQDEWDAGHIEGAQHIPLGELAARLAEAPKEQVVVAGLPRGSPGAPARRGVPASGC